MPVLGRHGRLRGVVSEADLIRDLVERDRRAHEIVEDRPARDAARVVGDVMTTHAITVRSDDDVADVVDLLTSTTVKSVPVVDGGHLAGMLSRSDVVTVFARADEELAKDVDAALVWVGLGEWTAKVTDGVVVLSGPDPSEQRALAHLVAGTVPGVVEVRRE
jgi:signal-transduction protein with cAMP-binding, CBS, and nucleotidyltransferase domain